MAEKFDRLHQTAKAEAEWRAALAIDPDSPAALDGLSKDLILENDYPEVVALLEDPRLDGERTSVQIVNLGLAYAGTGKLDEAAKVLRDGLNTAPDSLPIANELAEVLHKLGRSEEALAVLDLALERHPDDLNAKIHSFRILIDTNTDKAAEKGRSLLQTSANNWEVLYLNGILETKVGRLQQARSYLERSAKLKPDSGAPDAALGHVLAQLKDMRGAKEQLEKAIALGDKDDDVKQTLLTVLTSLGEGKAEQ
jgi:Flp pilus assembly protein TadD